MTRRTASSRSGNSARSGTSYGMRASRIFAFARTMRCAIVGAGVRNPLAISSVVRPQTSRSVRATWASCDRDGAHHSPRRQRNANRLPLAAAPERLFHLGDLGRDVGEVGDLEHLAQLDLWSSAVVRQTIEGDALGPLNRLFFRFHLDHPVP